MTAQTDKAALDLAATAARVGQDMLAEEARYERLPLEAKAEFAERFMLTLRRNLKPLVEDHHRLREAFDGDEASAEKVPAWLPWQGAPQTSKASAIPAIREQPGTEPRL